MKRDAFSDCHPTVNFLYFALVLMFTMFFMHPVCLAVSLFSALAYALCLNGAGAVARSLRYVLPVMLLAAAVNTAFNHEGVTVICYLPTGNPLTAESVIYGAAAAAMLAAVITWFLCFTAVITSDKFVYLFGRVIPALSLVLSMTLRFVPKFKAQLRAADEAQRCIGRGSSDGTALQRIKNAVAVLSVVVTWSLENAVETADSMKCRGYGLPRRTAFSIFVFGRRDKAVLSLLCVCGAYIICGWITGGFSWRYFPTVKGTLTGVYPVSLQLAYLLLCLTPVFMKLYEDRKLKRLQYGQ